MKNFSVYRMKSKNLLIIFFIYCSLNEGCAKTPVNHQGAEQARRQFNLRCASAGEMIKRTVENVEGIYIAKLRPRLMNYGDQYKFDDPYGNDYSEKSYMRSFLRGNYDVKLMTLSYISHAARDSFPSGYLYVVANDLADNLPHRYTGHIEEPWLESKHYLKGYFRFILDDEILGEQEMPRYGVTYDDISTLDDRALWIAGSSLKIIDLRTNEVIGERIGYMYDPAQGSKAGGREPWLLAADHACPQFDGFPGATSQIGQTVRFSEKVLHPKKEK